MTRAQRHPDRRHRSTTRSGSCRAPNALLIGIAPTGGRLPDDWRAVILAAIRSGLDVLSGLHTFLGDDPEFAEAARASGVRLIDFRRPPERMETAVGRRHAAGQAGDPRPSARTARSARCPSRSSSGGRRRPPAGRPSFVATGQTGMMIEGWGVTVDRVVADFLQGTVEWLVEEGERRGDWVIVEGQGSLDHPAYSSVTLGLIHGATPHAMVMVHKPGMADHDFDHLPGAPVPDRAAGRVHRGPRERGGPRRAVEGRRGRPQHLARSPTRTRRAG